MEKVLDKPNNEKCDGKSESGDGKRAKKSQTCFRTPKHRRQGIDRGADPFANGQKDSKNSLKNRHKNLLAGSYPAINKFISMQSINTKKS